MTGKPVSDEKYSRMTQRSTDTHKVDQSGTGVLIVFLQRAMSLLEFSMV